MRGALAAVFFVMVISCGGTSTAATPSPAGLLSNPCSYLSKADFQQTLGLSLEGPRSQARCAARGSDPAIQSSKPRGSET